MSIKIMNLVWESAPYSGNTLLTLLALADWSNDEGYSFPHLDQLAKKSRQSKRNVQRSLDQLTQDGVLSVQLNRGRFSRNEFIINTTKWRVSQTRHLRHLKATNTTVKGDICDIQTRHLRHRNKEEPSVEPSENHQGNQDDENLPTENLTQISLTDCEDFEQWRYSKNADPEERDFLDRESVIASGKKSGRSARRIVEELRGVGLDAASLRIKYGKTPPKTYFTEADVEIRKRREELRNAEFIDAIKSA